MKTIISGGKNEYIGGLNERNVAGIVLGLDEGTNILDVGALFINEKEYFEFDKTHLEAMTAYGLRQTGVQIEGSLNQYFLPYFGAISSIQLNMPVPTTVILLYKRTPFVARIEKLPDAVHNTRVVNGDHVILTSKSGSGTFIIKRPNGASVFEYSTGLEVSQAVFGMEGKGVAFTLGGEDVEIETNFSGYITVVEIRPEVKTIIDKLTAPHIVRRGVAPRPNIRKTTMM